MRQVTERYHVSVIALDQNTVQGLEHLYYSPGSTDWLTYLYTINDFRYMQLRFPMKMIKSQRCGYCCFNFIGSACYLGLSQRLSGPGFPLDDAWIHQTYARNLVLTGGWSYSGGQASAGSTSPLWTVLLSAGYLLRTSPIAWAVGLGVLCLFVTAWVGDKIWIKRSGDGKYTRLPLFAILLATEWHLVWAAISGMETILFILLIMCFAWLTLKSPKNWLMVGGVIGISVWVRPDGLTCLARHSCSPGFFR